VRRVYLDHNASSPLHPKARAAMRAWLDGTAVFAGNPSSIHAEGQRARAAVELARRQVAECVGGNLADIVFTSGATEANNLALRSLPHPVATSTVEHPSILSADVPLLPIAVDAMGRIPEDFIERATAQGARSISLMLANNETGNLHPVGRIAQEARAAGLPVHCDATQAIGRVHVSALDLGVDLLSFSSHKIGGPKGVGALWVDPDTVLDVLIRGGHQERGRRGGTENVLGAVGFGAAATTVGTEDQVRVATLRDALWAGIAHIDPGATINGDPAARLPNTLNVRFPDVDGEGLLMNLDLEGIAASAGSACSAGSLEPSHVILAMGVPQALARGSVRFSLGPATTRDEIDYTLERLQTILARLRAPGWATTT
jgi:cysteine desulfurase